MLPTSNILDTLRLDQTGFFLKELHAQRTFEAYQFLKNDISFETVLNGYNKAEIDLLKNFETPQRVRLIFDKSNFDYSLKTEPLDSNPANPVRLQILENANQPVDIEGQFKWEDRFFWDSILNQKQTAADDIISVNKNGFVTETSRFNIFIYSEKDKMVYTPDLDSGCINGVYRRHILKNKSITLPGIGPKKVIEINFTPADLLQEKIYVTNSVREVLNAELI